MEDDLVEIQDEHNTMNQYLDHEQLIASNIEEDSQSMEAAENEQPKPMSEEQWANASPEQMAEHISLEGPKTDYAKETNNFRKNADKL